jgi:serine/threonine protein kinase
MTALRHPNVVLFMAASTKAPKMCIVMEFMTLGSLYDVRLPLPQLQFLSAISCDLLFSSAVAAQRAGARIALCAQSQNGLPSLQGDALPPLFGYDSHTAELHAYMKKKPPAHAHLNCYNASCATGIVHRDLKSLNLLLDNKWNVKVLYLSRRLGLSYGFSCPPVDLICNTNQPTNFDGRR